MKIASFSEIQTFAIHKLTVGLSEKLTYHHVKHTLDVLEQCQVIAELEEIKTEEEVFLLKISALYHDVGFLQTYQGHEEKSCEIAETDLTRFGLSATQKEVVFNLIRATQVPQNPQSKLAQIICDADLDYLGRRDFYEIGQGLFQEFLWQGIVTNELEWNKIQVRFLESHQYFTASSKQRREKQKQEYLQQVKAKVVQLEQQF